MDDPEVTFYVDNALTFGGKTYDIGCTFKVGLKAARKLVEKGYGQIVGHKKTAGERSMPPVPRAHPMECMGRGCVPEDTARNAILPN
jgi:hypothetical protein